MKDDRQQRNDLPFYGRQDVNFAIGAVLGVIVWLLAYEIGMVHTPDAGIGIIFAVIFVYYVVRKLHKH